MKATYKSNINNFFEDLMQNITKSIEKQNDAAVKAAKAYAPVNTGKLKNSIDGEVTSDNEEIISTVYADTDYAIYQELGTSRVPGQHYLKKGVINSVKVLEGEFK